jgi:antirestriction protein ArdC
MTTKTPRRTNADVDQQVTDTLLARLDSGVVPWHQPWAGGIPVNHVSHKPYRGINVAILASAGYASPYWLTYNQAKERGGQVRGGEHGQHIILWKPIEVHDKESDDADATKRVWLLRSYVVFNAEQVDGIDFPEPAAIVGDPVAKAEAILAAYHGPTMVHEGARAFYSPPIDRVVLPPRETFESHDAYYATAFHELAHSTGHGTRLDRPGVTNTASFGSHTYAEEELVAEFGSAFLCGTADIDRQLDASAAYIASWKRALTENPTWAVSAASKAQKAADFIIGEEGTS